MSKSVETNVVTVDDVVVNSVLEVLLGYGLMTKGARTEWTGTMTDLRSELVKVVGRKNAATLPQSASALRVVLNRVVSRIRCRGVTVKFTRSTDSSRTRLVRFVG